MKHNRSSSFESQPVDAQEDKGFTLIEILIAIVLVGILSAVAVVGISNLVSKGSTSACGASLDASKAASAVYFAGNSNTYPTTFGAMTAGGQLTLPTAAVVVDSTSPRTATNGWVLSMTPGVGTAAPTFACT
jgi:prepilin-type N-terminal cleavage/methylation domain-containing protein